MTKQRGQKNNRTKKTGEKTNKTENKQDRKQKGQKTNRMCLLTSLYIHPLAGLAGDTLPLHGTTASAAASETLVQLVVAKGVAHHLAITISITVTITIVDNLMGLPSASGEAPSKSKVLCI